MDKATFTTLAKIKSGKIFMQYMSALAKIIIFSHEIFLSNEPVHDASVYDIVVRLHSSCMSSVYGCTQAFFLANLTMMYKYAISIHR